MEIRVRLYGGLRRYASSGAFEMQVPENATVADVIASLNLPSGEVWLTTLSEQLVEMDHPLGPGDEVLLIPPVGGGDGSKVLRQQEEYQ